MDTQEENQQRNNDVARIAAYIPGFKGYSDSEQRNDSDMRVRSAVARKLDLFKTALAEIIQTVAAEKRLDLLSDYDGLVTSIGEFQILLKEPPGDCGDFFQLQSVKEENTSDIYRLDLQLLEKAAHFLEQLETLKQSPFERSDARSLDSRLREMITCFTERAISMKGCHQIEQTLSDS